MTVPTDSGFDAAAAAVDYGMLHLVELQFGSGTLRMTNYPLDVVALGQTWQGLGMLGEVGTLHESEDGNSEKLELTLSQVSTSNLALGLGNTSNYQDRPAKVWVALLDAKTMQLSGAPTLRFVGAMDTVGISPGDTDEDGKITLTCVTAAYDVRNNPSSLRMNNAQHQARHPGERGFEMLSSLIGTPSIWLSQKFQRYL